jgi:hypothetical protein
LCCWILFFVKDILEKCRFLHQMAMVAPQRQIQQQYCLCCIYCNSQVCWWNLSGDPTFEGAVTRLGCRLGSGGECFASGCWLASEWMNKIEGTH